MTRRITATLALLGVLAAGGVQMLSFQDVDTEAARQAAREAAAARARQQQLDREYKAQQDWLKRAEDQSNANLNRMADTLARQKINENERKFQALHQSSQQLVDLSVKTFNQIHSSGAQSVSVSLFADLDKMEKLIKDIRKNAR
jgi:type II secretory pathway pseudopilin PulG